MKKRNDLRSIVAAALIVYSVFTALTARRKLAEAGAYLAELRVYADGLTAEAEAYSLRLSQAPDDAYIERLAREKLALVKQGEIIFRFD